jgi:hypothetical protein
MGEGIAKMQKYLGYTNYIKKSNNFMNLTKPQIEKH